MTPDHALTALAISAILGLTAALLILWSGAYVAVCRALDTRHDRRARHAPHNQHTAATEALDDACCERWWTSLATDHDFACPNQTRREPR